MSLKIRLRPCCNSFLISLHLFIFMKWFGIPSVQKFLKKDLQIVETTELATMRDIPAVTVCPQAFNSAGWKEGYLYPQTSVLKHICGSNITFENLISCIENRTYILMILIFMVLSYYHLTTHLILWMV